MSILSRNEILKLINKKELAFNPTLDELQLQTHSIDLRLGYTFMVPRRWKVTKNGREALVVNTSTTDDTKSYQPVELEEGQFFELLPGEFIITTTLERIKMPTSVMATLYPRSSLNRKGLSINLTGIVDAGYEGNLITPIENKNQQPVRIYPGERFCQLTFHEIAGDVKPGKSRWHKKDIVVGLLPEKDMKESELITTGNIRELKDDYKIKKTRSGKK